MSQSLKQTLQKVSKERLIDYLVDYTQLDETLYRGLMTQFSTPADDDFIQIKEGLSHLIDSHTHRGYIDERNCDKICFGMDDYIQMANNRIDQKEPKLAYSIGIYLLKTGMILASEADSSSGYLNQTIEGVLTLLAHACQVIANYGTAHEREVAFHQGLTLAEDEVFDGWGRTNYELLVQLCPLLTAENAPQLEALLARLAPRFEWASKTDEYLVRLEMKRYLEGEIAANEYLLSHLDIDEFRVKAYMQAFAEEDYEFSIQLCQEILDKEGRQKYHWNHVWQERLFAVYEATKDITGQKNWAMENLAGGSFSSYGLLKKLLQADGEWDTSYPKLLEMWKTTLNPYLYMKILKEEQEWARLFSMVEQNPAPVILEYGPSLASYAPQIIYPLMADEIQALCTSADNRKGYRHVCREIRTLIQCGGSTEACQLITHLSASYPRRRALQEELQLAKEELRIS